MLRRALFTLSGRAALLALCFPSLLSLSIPPARQAPGFAEISGPRPSQVVAGVVTIVGTADHPSFDRFELAFGYDPDDTETWFPIGEPISTPVIDGRLALWDTSGITDGTYRLRLRVWLTDGQSLEATVEGLRLHNYTPTQTPQVPAAAQIEPQPLTPIPTQSQPAASETIPAEPARNRMSLSLFIGGAVAGFILGGLALYRQIGSGIRAHIAHLRIRRVHRQLDRARRSARTE